MSATKTPYRQLSLTGAILSTDLAGAIADGKLASSYLYADGTRPLTANWDAGAFSGTFNSVAIGNAANTIAMGSGSGGNGVLTSTSSGTKGKISIGNSMFDEANNRFGVNATPLSTERIACADGSSRFSYGNVTGAFWATMMTNTVSSGSGYSSYQAIAGTTGAVIGAFTTYIPTDTTTSWGISRGGWTMFSQGGGNGMGFGTNNAVPIMFATNNLERMRLDSSGNLGIGQTVPSAKLDVTVNAIAATSTDAIAIVNTTAATSGITSQRSGRLRLTGSAWNTTVTAATNTADWIVENRPVSGATVTSTLGFASQVNAGGFTDRLTLTSAGLLTCSSISTTGITVGANGVTTTIYLSATISGMTTTSTAGTQISSSQVASVGTPVRYSPYYSHISHVWNTTSAADNTFIFGTEVRPTSAAVPTARWVLWSNNNAAGFVDKVSVFDNGNIGFGTTDFGSGVKVLGIANGTAPSATPVGGGVLYVESGALKFKGSSGTVTTLGVA